LLPVDLLALICSFQFSSRHSSTEQRYNENSGMYGAYGAGRHMRAALSRPGVMQLARRSAVQQPAPVPEVAVRPDDALLSIRTLFTMTALCRHWQRAVKPPEHCQYQRLLPPGCRLVDCWSGVQQLEMKQCGRHVTIGGLLVKRKHVEPVLKSLTQLHSIYLEFNVHPSAVDEADHFTHLLPGSTVASFYPQLQQLTIRLVHTYVHPQHVSRRAHRSRRHQQHSSPQQLLYSQLSAWLDCHPQLRSFALLDPHATMPMPLPIAPFAAAPMMALPRPQPFQPFPMAIFPPFNPMAVNFNPLPAPPPPFPLQLPPLPPFPMPAPFGAFPGAPQYRPPAVPQPSAGALRLLCTGRLQHVAMAGETLVRLASGEKEERERKEEEGQARHCFQAEAVQSIDLIGDYQQPRYINALYDALPSLTHLTLSRVQLSTGAAQVLAKVGHRVTLLRGSISSLVSLSLPAVVTSCSALQSLYIQTHHTSVELAQLYAALPSLPSLTQLSVIEQQQPGNRYPAMHNLPELSLPPLPELLYLHLQLSSYRVFPLVANRTGPPSAILPAKLTHLLLAIPGQQLVPHLSSVPVLCPKLTHCHINSGASVTSQTWETRLGRLKARLRGVWCESEGEVVRHRMDVAWRAEAGLKGDAAEEWEAESW